jgi:hypothetical protein
LSDPLVQDAGMKLNANIRLNEDRSIIAWFGTARLLRDRRGIVELEGGSPSDRQVALEWVSLFLHEAAPRVVAEN